MDGWMDRWMDGLMDGLEEVEVDVRKGGGWGGCAWKNERKKGGEMMWGDEEEGKKERKGEGGIGPTNQPANSLTTHLIPPVHFLTIILCRIEYYVPVRRVV
ncbi:hypothetical protein BKA81DRAFT_367441 [Phyllosticta paracitricarpa]